MISIYNTDEIITAKRDGRKLSSKQIDWFINGILKGDIPDFQTSALLMAIYLNGLDEEETASLTSAMLHSGSVLDFNDPRVIDKHSTGGVGDKTSLILGPIAAAAGVKVPMISGRGLGHTGGTLDKMESIPGFKTELATDDFLSVVNTIGIAIVGQTQDLAPADKIIYNLRNLTGTVASIPLITSSIMSKKLAEGTSGLVLDIKVGQGAFMKNFSDAQKLARSMRETTRSFGKSIMTLITDMSQPLGRAIGNSNEVIESIETLKGQGPEDVTRLSVELAAGMIHLAGLAPSLEAARQIARDQIISGKALQKFAELVGAQGGDTGVLSDYGLLPMPTMETPVVASEDGYVHFIDVLQLGNIVCLLGGGRKSATDQVDHSVGILNFIKIGMKVKKGDVLAVIQHHGHQSNLVKELSEGMSRNIYQIKNERVYGSSELILEVQCHLAHQGKGVL